MNSLTIFYLFVVFIRTCFGDCMNGGFLNICGVCVEGNSGLRHTDGLDRCGVCGGDGACVGCDGLVNSTRRTDICGLCLSPKSEQWNECRKIDSVNPAVLERALGDELVTLTVSGAGLRHSDLKPVQCYILPEEGQDGSPNIEAISVEDDDIELKIRVGPSLGRYRIICSDVEGLVHLTVVNSLTWSVVRVAPEQLLTDIHAELLLDVTGTRNYEGSVWCFVRNAVTKDLQVVEGSWLSSSKVHCAPFQPRVPGIFHVGAAATWDVVFDEGSTGGTAEVSVKGKPPQALSAEYSPDMTEIWIAFDQNIEMTSNCSDVFNWNTVKHFGSSYHCRTSGDKLIVDLGEDGALLDTLEIVAPNGLRRAGARQIALSPTALPAVLVLSKQKVVPPKLSLALPMIMCAAKESLVDLKVSSIGNQHLKYDWTTRLSLDQSPRRSQRENLMLWESSRELQRELNAKDDKNSPTINSTVLVPNMKYVIDVKGKDTLGHEQETSSTLRYSPSAIATVMITAPPSSSAIAAEVAVTMCKAVDVMLQYLWFVDDHPVAQDGRILLVRGLAPGSYNVSCVVVLNNSTDVLGSAWTVTEIVKPQGEVTIVPSEVVIGTMDSVVLRAVAPGWTTPHWSCRTVDGDPCVAAGPQQLLVEHLVVTNTTRLMIPASVLPVGRYMWSLSLDHVKTEATVLVVPGIPPHLEVQALDMMVDPSKPLALCGEARRLRVGCRLWWTTVRRRGFNFFNLQEDVGLGDMVRVLPDEALPEERGVPLLVPEPTGRWEGLAAQSSYLLRLHAACSQPRAVAHIDTPVVVNGPPQIFPISVTPSSGLALTTRFEVLGGEARDLLQDYPLMYYWGFKTSNGVEGVLKAGIYSRHLDLVLPPGNVFVTVKVCDILSVCSEESSSLIVVEAPQEYTEKLMEAVEVRFQHLMTSGDTVEALGLIITSFKCLEELRTPAAAEQLARLSRVSQEGIYERANTLEAKLQSDPSWRKTALEFLEQSVATLKYLPEQSKAVSKLNQLKEKVMDKVTERRRRRQVAAESTKEELEDSSVRMVLDLHMETLKTADTKSNRERLFSDVRKYMGSLCAKKPSFPIVIDSAIVTLDVRMFEQRDMNKYQQMFHNQDTQFELKSRLLQKKMCLASARFKQDFKADTQDTRLSDMYEVQLVSSGDGALHISGPKDGMNVLSLPVRTQTKDMECRMWNRDSGWTRRCSVKATKPEVAVCVCRDFGYVAVFTNSSVPQPTPTVSTTSSTATTPTTTSSTTTTTSTTNTPPTITTTTTATIPTTNTTPTATTTASLSPSTPTNSAEHIEFQQDTCIASFRIDEVFSTTVGNNPDGLVESLKLQILNQLEVPSSVIRSVSVRPGSIMVTVILTDPTNHHVDTVVKDLAARLSRGELHLVSPQGVPLHVPKQDLLVHLPPKPHDTTRLRIITYSVVGSSFAIVALFGVGVVLAKRRRLQPLALPKLALDETPQYQQFYNEYSLDGSAASLARYRREPDRSQTMQSYH